MDGWCGVSARQRGLPSITTAVAVGLALVACVESEPRTLTGPMRANAGEDFTTVVGRPTELRGSSNVPSARPVWQQMSGSVVALNRPDPGPLSFRRTFTAPQFTGELAFSHTVFDGGRRATDEVIVTVVEQVFFVELGDGFAVQPGARVELEANVVGATEPDLVQYTWSRVLGPEAPGIEGATGRTLSFSAPPEEGSLMVRVEAADPSGQDDSDTIVLEIRERNEPPVAVIAGEDHLLRQFESLTLDGSESFDPDGRSLAFAWRQTSGPDDATLPLVDADSPIARVDAPPVAGTYRVELEVTDRGGATGRAEAEVLVRPNPGPEIVVDFPTANANIGDTVQVFQMRGTVSDPDGVATLEIDGEAVLPSSSGAWTATLTWSPALTEGVSMRAVDGTGAAQASRYPLAATTPVLTPVDLDVHPDGTRVVIADRGSQRVFEVALETGIPTTLAARGDGRGPDVAVPMGAVWDASGDRVIVSAFDALYGC